MSAQLLVDGIVAHANPEAVLFDKDGTIIDIHHYWDSMIRIRSALVVKRWFSGNSSRHEIQNQLIDSMGLSLNSGRIKAEGPVGVKPRSFIVNVVADVVCDYGVDIANTEMELLFSEVDQAASEELLPLLDLLPGVESLLQQLKERGVMMAIVSSDITSRARKAMELLGLDYYFDDIIGSDQVEHSKPAADLALLALERFGVLSERAVVIGDHPVDIEMGNHAGVGLKIRVLTGLADVDAFEDLGCRVVSDLTAIEVR